MDDGAIRLLKGNSLEIAAKHPLAYTATGAGAGSTTITIPEVNLEMAVIKCLIPGQTVAYGECSIGARFGSSTSVVIEWSAGKSGSSNVLFYGEVIEYKAGIKSIQFVSGGDGSILEVDSSQASIVIASSYCASNVDRGIRHSLASATSVLKTSWGGAVTTVCPHLCTRTKNLKKGKKDKWLFMFFQLMEFFWSGLFIPLLRSLCRHF